MTRSIECESPIASSRQPLGNPLPAEIKAFVYVSSAEDGDIDAYSMDVRSGELLSLGKTRAGKQVMPMALSPDGRHLYAVVRSLPYCVLTYQINAQTGKLHQCACAPLPDRVSYVSTDASGRFLFTASYGGSFVAVSAIEPSGAVEKAVCRVIPTGKHAHSIRANRRNQFVYAPNLGSDQITQFRFDDSSGMLIENEPAQVKTPSGSGPRHMVFSPDEKYLYVLHELSGEVGQFAIDPLLGTLLEIAYTSINPKGSGLLPGLPPGTPPTSPSFNQNTMESAGPRIWAADLQMTPDGRFLYATERTTSKIALLRVAAGTGRLNYVTHYATETQPRSIRIDPTGQFLVAAGQKSDRISVYRIDQADGSLSPVGRYPVGQDANWVEIVSFPTFLPISQPTESSRNEY